MANTQELLVGFVAESAEALSGLDDRFLAVERGDTAAVADIFRPVHLLKGNAAFFGLQALKESAHELETVLDRLRSGRQVPGRPVVDACLAALDGLRGMLASLMAGGPEVPDPSARDLILRRLRGLGNGWPRALELARGLRGQSAQADELLTILLGLAGGEAQAVASSSSIQMLADPSRELADLLIVARAGAGGADQAGQISTALNRLQAAASDAVAQAAWVELDAAYRGIVEAVGFDTVALDVLADYLPKTVAKGRWCSPQNPLPASPELTPTAALPTAALEPASEPANEPGTDRRERQTGSESLRKTLRVPEADVDAFLGHIGDLMVAGDGLGHIAKRMAAGAETAQVLPELRRSSRDIGQIADHLQAAVMRLRRVELAPQLRKAVRIARDVSATRRKEITVEVEDGDLSIDKALIGIIDAALLHLVRNSADHGIEMPDHRTRAGKPRQGRIDVIASMVGGELCLRIADDGAGIDPVKVRAKAESMGLVAPGEPLGERQLIELVFAPGVSTAAKVTDVSGRGVGLDAVKRAVEESGGSIRIDNRPGSGCAFELRLPVSVATQIIPAYMFTVAGQPFGLPMAVVGETFRCAASELRDIDGGFAIMRHGGIVRVIEAATVLAPDAAVVDGERLMVTVDPGDGPFVLAIGAVLGVQQVVVRRIDASIAMPSWTTGAALMGDGSVAMLVDPVQLVARR